MNIEWSIAAEAEYFEIMTDYDWKGPGLGDRFALSVRNCVAAIAESPFRCPTIFKDARRTRVHKFPYSLVYQIKNDVVRIVAVTHDKRRPLWWKSRILK